MWRVAVMPVCIIDSLCFIRMRQLFLKCRLPNVNSSAAVENGSICVSCHCGFRLVIQGLIILNFALACFGFPCRFIALRQSYFQLPIAAFCGNVLPLSCENIAFWGENIRRFHAIISPLSCGKFRRISAKISRLLAKMTAPVGCIKCLLLGQCYFYPEGF